MSSTAQESRGFLTCMLSSLLRLCRSRAAVLVGCAGIFQHLQELLSLETQALRVTDCCDVTSVRRIVRQECSKVRLQCVCYCLNGDSG